MSRTTKTAAGLAGALLLLLAAAGGVAQEGESDAERKLYRAFWLETGLRDFEAAAAAWEEAAEAARSAGRDDLRARALTGRGRSLLVLERRDEAKAALEAALRVDPESAEAARLLAGLEAGEGGDRELEARIRALVARLSEPPRKATIDDIVLVGDRAVPFLAEALRSREVGVVEGAAHALARIGSAPAHAALAAAFRDDDVVFPNVIVAMLPGIFTSKRGGFEVFLAALDGVPPDLRDDVLRTLRQKWEGRFRHQMDNRKLVALLVPFLREGTPEERNAALPFFLYDEARSAIDEENEAAVRSALIEILRSPEPNTVAHVWRALPAFWNESAAEATVAAALAMIRGERPYSGAVVGILVPPDALPVPEEDLLRIYALAGAEDSRILDKNRASLRNAIAQTLLQGTKPRQGTKSDAEAAARIFREGFDRIPDAYGRFQWLDLWEDRTDLPVEDLVHAAADPAPQVRGRAYEELRERAVPEDLPSRLPHLEDDLRAAPDWPSRVALQMLERVPAPELLPVLDRLLSREELPENFRIWITLAAARAGGERALPVLRRAMADPRLRPHAAKAFVEALGEDAVPELVELAREPSDALAHVQDRYGNPVLSRDELARYVEALPPELVQAEFVDRAVHRLGPEARRALVLDSLRREDANAPLLAAAAEAVKRYLIEDAWPLLVPLLEHESQSVRRAAREALEAIRAHRDLVGAFARYGEGGRQAVLDRAVALTRDEAPEKRRGGALALGALGEPAGIPALLDLLDDPEETVRDAALAALERLGGGPGEGEGGE